MESGAAQTSTHGPQATDLPSPQQLFRSSFVPQHIMVINFAPNLTSRILPLDQGISTNLKIHYCARLVQRAVNQFNNDITLNKLIWGVNILQAIRMIESSWAAVSTRTIYNCWRHSGILDPTHIWSKPN